VLAGRRPSRPALTSPRTLRLASLPNRLSLFQVGQSSLSASGGPRIQNLQLLAHAGQIPLPRRHPPVVIALADIGLPLASPQPAAGLDSPCVVDAERRHACLGELEMMRAGSSSPSPAPRLAGSSVLAVGRPASARLRVDMNWPRTSGPGFPRTRSHVHIQIATVFTAEQRVAGVIRRPSRPCSSDVVAMNSTLRAGAVWLGRKPSPIPVGRRCRIRCLWRRGKDLRLAIRPRLLPK